MSPRRQTKNGTLAAFAALAGCLLAPFSARAEARRRPNVIVVIVDDLPRNLSTFLPEGEGHAYMPTLQAMADEGVVLSNMRSPSPVCTPSRFAILTGTYPSRCEHPWFKQEAEDNGQAVIQFNTHLNPGQPTLAAWMKNAGYATGAVGKNHVISVPGYEKLPYSADPTDPGVASVIESNAAALREAFQNAGFDEAEALYFGNPDADGIKALAVHNQEWVTNAALGFIDRHADEPFFLLMSTTLTHGPYNPERSYKADPRITAEGYIETPPVCQAPRSTIEPRLEEAGISGFNTGNVLWFDDAIAAVRDRLSANAIAGDTVIFVISDHGMGAKGTCYEAATKTAALAWREGGFRAASPITADLSLVDVAPTVLDLAGADTGSLTFDGRSFAPLLAGAKIATRDVVYSEMGFSRAVKKGRYKYLALRYPEYAVNMSDGERAERLEDSNAKLRERGIELLTEDPSAPFSHLFLIPGGHDTDRVAITKYPGYFDADQLYDLETDRGEQHNLAADPEYAEVLTEMKQLLDEQIAALPGTFGEFGRGSASASEGEH